MMTNKEYSDDGNKCPVCESTNLNANELVNNGSRVSQQVLDCNECKAKWVEKYKLFEYQILSHTAMPALQIEVLKAAR